VAAAERGTHRALDSADCSTAHSATELPNLAILEGVTKRQLAYKLSAIADWIEYWSVRDVKLTYVCCPFYSPAMQSMSIVTKVPFEYVLDLHK
jgi:hypothetical protein